MTEDPIKLFASRSERFPQSDSEDTLRAAIEKAVEQLGLPGAAINFVTSRFWAPAGRSRLESWLKDFADDYERHCQHCTVEKMVENEVFISASIQIARMVVATHSEEKREYLRNALLNIALGKQQDETKQQIFLNAIEAFSPAHIKALNLIWRQAQQPISWDHHSIPINQRNYASALGVVVPELRGQVSLIGAVFAELRNRGFANISSPENLPFPQPSLITNLGVDFMNFVMSPQIA